jgi:hypothetical protein
VKGLHQPIRRPGECTSSPPSAGAAVTGFADWAPSRLAATAGLRRRLEEIAKLGDHPAVLAGGLSHDEHAGGLVVRNRRRLPSDAVFRGGRLLDA